LGSLDQLRWWRVKPRIMSAIKKTAAGSGSLLDAIQAKTAHVAVIGLGYVGLPLTMAVARGGYPTTGYDIDPSKIAALSAGRSYIDAVPSEDLQSHLKNGRVAFSSEEAVLSSCDVIIICVPTPLTRYREPDLSYIRKTAEVIAAQMKPGTLVVLESTTYPGTTEEVLKPMLEKSGLACGVDFFVGFSPEREDPGNRHFNTVSIPKVVAGDGALARDMVVSFYGNVVEKVVPVSTPATAEAVKITENVFRAVNIALVNELKVIYDAMGIDVWEVIDAAKTKPFGYQAFYPGPGLGGHCIPIDPFYLTWKAREFEIDTQFIELAGQINTAMPRYVISKLEEALGSHLGKALAGSKILILGLAYKKNVADMRESPTFKLMELLEKRGAHVAFHDPHIPDITPTREHQEYTGRKSLPLNEANLRGVDAVILSTDHDDVDYELVARTAKLVVDTRNRFSGLGGLGARIVKA
jgi:UDP-N-acetyl-D-glucosamine dehydrogenase